MPVVQVGALPAAWVQIMFPQHIVAGMFMLPVAQGRYYYRGEGLLKLAYSGYFHVS